MEWLELIKNPNTFISRVVQGVTVAAILAIGKGIWNLINHKPFLSGLWSLVLWPFKKFYWLLLQVRNLVLGVIKWIIRPVVIEIIEEQTQKNGPFEREDRLNKKQIEDLFEDDKDLILLGDKLTLGGDDHFYPELLNFDTHEYGFLLLRIEGDHWRFGWKLSQKQTINQIRQQRGYPIVHLEKNSNSPAVKFVYINRNGEKEVSREIIKQYKDLTIGFILEKRDKTLVIEVHTVRGNKRIRIFTHKIRDNLIRYGMPMAWGDGNEFEIALKMKEFERQSSD